MSPGTLQALESRRREWAPWLALVDAVHGEAHGPQWEAMVPAPGAVAPLLAGTCVRGAPSIRRLLRVLVNRAARVRAPALAALAAAPDLDRHADVMFEAAVNADAERLDALAPRLGLDAGALRAFAGLLPLPFLRACARAWESRLPRGWREGWCPVCAGWPAFAEVCGVERSRRLRCGACTSAWASQCLNCAYCGNHDHERLGTLRVEDGGQRREIEICAQCGCYLKSFTVLRAGSPDSVAILDLDSVELDIAATARGYRRPAGPACALGLTLAAADRCAA